MKLKSLLLLPLLGGTLLYAELFTEYFKNGVVKSQIQYRDGTRTDTAEGIKEGLEKVFYNTGEVAYTVRNVNGKRDGEMDWYDRDGKHLETVNYKEGMRHGLNMLFYANGNIRIEVNYVNDKKEGSETYYFDTGALASKVNYKNGLKEGMQKEYNEDGSLNNEVMYHHGYKEGQRRWYDKKGKVIRKETYKMDRPIDVMKRAQAKKPDATIEALQGLNFNPNDRKVK